MAILFGCSDVHKCDISRLLLGGQACTDVITTFPLME